MGYQSFGTKDCIEGEDFKALVPDNELVIIQDGHHLIHQEKAEHVNAEIMSFFKWSPSVTNSFTCTKLNW